jgi:hypothetical protein
MTFQITQNNGWLHAPVFSFDPLPFFFDALPVPLLVEKKRQGNEAISPVQRKLLILLSQPFYLDHSPKKNIMKKLGSLLFSATLATAMLSQVHAQTNDEEAAVRACLALYMTGDGMQMEKAFHPSASMKYIDYKTGEYKDVPIAEFLARVKANTSKPERKTEIVSMNIDGTAAQAKIRIEQGNTIFVDYMNLLKIDGNWKIVSKIFQRRDK